MNIDVRAAPVLPKVDVTWVLFQGRRLSYFGGSDYLRLSWHPEVRDACAEGVAEYGPSAGASRMTTGNAAIYNQLEGALAKFFGVPAVTLASSGYLAPMVAAQALAPDHTGILLDERAHACLIDAAALTGLPVVRFTHRDAKSLSRALRRCRRGARMLVMTDGLFSHSGEVAPLVDYLAVLPDSATLLIDDAHGAGVIGRQGRGAPEWAGISLKDVVLTSTLSKAFGCYGGIILGTQSLRHLVLSRSRIFVGNTSVPPPCAQGALAAVRVLTREGAERRARLSENTRQLKEAIRSAGGRVSDGPGPMISLAPSGDAATERLKRMLRAADIHPPHIAYPNGPAQRYFRFAISSEHTAGQLAALGGVLHEFHRGRP